MGKSWDKFDDANSGLIGFQNFICNVFTEVYRVLKPGGHCLVWALPRTAHHTAMGLERAGFEIRDEISNFYDASDDAKNFIDSLDDQQKNLLEKAVCDAGIVSFCFGTGFPKSMNVGKMIDKLQGNEREVVGSSRAGSKERKGYKGDMAIMPFETKTINLKVTKGTSEWEGWGTALKPAHEVWWLVRKPLSEKSVSENVLKHGTGGINIDASRISHNEEQKFTERKQRSATWNPDNCGFDSTNNNIASANPQGRFPSNIILSHSEGCRCVDDKDETEQWQCVNGCPVKIIDEQSGFSQTKRCDKPSDCGGNTWGGTFQTNRGARGYTDAGGASRFFYCAKPSRSERDEGCEELEEKHFQMRPFAEEGCDQSVLKNRMNSKVGKNNHPTVKSIKLMEYLVKLITPENGTVLDPFMGSGTTGVACVRLGKMFIGIEKEKEYFVISEKRIKNSSKTSDVPVKSNVGTKEAKPLEKSEVDATVEINQTEFEF